MENPHMQEQVLEVLDKLRPFLLRDGGDVELVDIEEGIVKLRLMGACGSCPSSTITLKAGIERALLEE
ncbi:MAG: NifU family protein, partial [Bacillus mycoides]